MTASKAAEKAFNDLANAIGTQEMLRLLIKRTKLFHAPVYTRKLQRVYDWATCKDDR